MRCPACGGEFSGVVKCRSRNGIATLVRPRKYCDRPECIRARTYASQRAWAEKHRPTAKPRPTGPRPARSTEASRKEAAADARQASQAAGRRWGIDPCTCEREYADDELELLRAMDEYKRRCKRPFPTYSEVLQVVISLGYRKVEQPGALPGC